MAEIITRASLRRQTQAASRAVALKAPAVWMPPFSAFGIPEPVREYRFDAVRRWRVDYCWPDLRLAVEIEGGAFLYGRHNRAVSFLKDMEKYNALALAGFCLLRFTPDQMASGEGQEIIKNWCRLNCTNKLKLV